MSEALQRTGVELAVNIDPSHDKTPTLGSTRSLLRELFGNIGAMGQGGQSAPTTDNPAIGGFFRSRGSCTGPLA